MDSKMIKIIFSLMCIFCFTKYTLAFDYDSVNISNKFYTRLISDSAIPVELPSSLKDYNSKIYYQYLETTKENVDNYETKIDEISDIYDSCKSNVRQNYDYITLYNEMNAIKDRLISEGINDYYSNQEYIAAKNAYDEMHSKFTEEDQKCYDNFEVGSREVAIFIQIYDNTKWKEKTIDEEKDNYEIYRIPKEVSTKYFWLWVKAKDIDNSDIYNVFRIIGNSSYNPDNTIDESGSINSESSDNTVDTTNTSQNDKDKSNEVKTVDQVTNNPKTGTIGIIALILFFIIGLTAYFFIKRNSKIRQI